MENITSNEFQGLTRDDCVKGCNEAGCIISGKPYCAHPLKGVPQGQDAKNEDIVARYERARSALGLKPHREQEIVS
jgi:hypothetical protein